MKSKTKAVLWSVALCFVAIGVCWAADAFTGTWKLNEGKSKFYTGATKNTKVVYEDQGENVKITIDGVNGEGKPTHNEWVGKLDGKDYPVTGSVEGETRALKKIDEHTLELTIKQGDKVTTTGKIVLSADGKSRTVTTNGSDPKGHKVHITAVYEKQ